MSRLDQPQTPWRALIGLVLPHRSRMALMSLVLAAAGAIPLAGPLIVATFIDAATSGEPRSRLVLLAGIYVVLGLLGQVLSVAVAWSATDLAWRVTNELRSTLARHVMRLDLSFHRSTSSGALVSRVDDDVTKMNEFVAYFAVNAMAAFVTLIGLVIVVLVRDWRIGLALGAYLGIAFATMFSLRNRAVDDAATEQASSSRLYGEIEERLAGADDLRSNGGGSHALATLQRSSASVLAASLRREREGVTLWVIANAVFLVGGLAMLALDSVLLRRGSITLGTAYLLFQYTQVLRQPLSQLADETQRVQQAAGGMARTIELLAEESAIKDRGSQALPSGPLGLTLDAVGFLYDDEEDPTPVLHDIDLELQPGQTLGVLGRTGSGKTTLARLLLRLVEPSTGTVTLGGVELADIPMAELRARTGVVSQDVHLFGASIHDNLTLFDDTIDESSVRDALRSLDLLDWVEAMPEGLATVLGPGGTGLSAGEGQLIALARLFLRSPDLVLLDEASSRIDPATEARVTKAIDRLLDGRTAVVIAHRLTTVERLDQILVLDAGHVAEHGATAALRADPDSRYSQLLALGLDAPELDSPALNTPHLSPADAEATT